jgi:thiamine biosynthesis lipoprotein
MRGDFRLYERFFVKDGVTYHHIFDTKTGYPAKSGLKSVTVVSNSGTLADAYSTALFVMGLSDAMEFCRERPQIGAVFVTDDNKVYVTESIRGKFTLTDEENYKIY